MRAIKFRAWHRKRKKMYSLVEFRCDEQGVHVFMVSNSYDGPWFEVSTDDVELRMFTGLPDKQGKDIYEGDIVHCHTHHAKFIVKWCDSKGAWHGAPVGWILNDGYYTTEFEASTKHPSEHEHEYADITILGNIYEHPVLLKDMGPFGYDPITGEQKQS